MIILTLNDMSQDGIKYLIDMKDHLIDQEESTEVPKDHEGKNSFYTNMLILVIQNQLNLV